MNQAEAERWVTVSAVVVAGIYAYRRLTEDAAPPVTLKKLIGVGELPPLGSFATAWGFTFLVIAIMTEAAPGLGGAFAILIATSDFLTNSASVFADVGRQEGAQQASRDTVNAGAREATHATTTTNPVQKGAQGIGAVTTVGVGAIGGQVSGF